MARACPSARDEMERHPQIGRMLDQGRTDHLADAAGAGDPAVIENHHLGADLFHLRKQVRAQHDRCASGISYGANNVENLS